MSIVRKEKPESNQDTSPQVQTKMEIGQPGDKYEQEADQVADDVVNNSPEIQTMANEEEDDKIQMIANEEEDKVQMMANEEEEEKVQMKAEASPSENNYASQDVADRIDNSKGKGSSLPDDIQQELGGNMKSDFSDVNIHTDKNAIHMNKELGAKAFTHGKDIYFNEGKYNPNSSEGKHLLAHELTHTQQQSGGEVKAKIQKQNGEDPTLEKKTWKGKTSYKYTEDGKKTWITPYKIDYIKNLGYDLFEMARDKDYSSFAALFIEAQASLESDYGVGNWGDEIHNPFSIMGGTDKRYSNSHGTLQKYNSWKEGFDSYIKWLGKVWGTTVKENTGLYYQDSFSPDDANKAFRQYNYYGVGGGVYKSDRGSSSRSDYGLKVFKRMRFLAGPKLVILKRLLKIKRESLANQQRELYGEMDRKTGMIIRNPLTSEERAALSLGIRWLKRDIAKLETAVPGVETARGLIDTYIAAHEKLKTDGKIVPKPMK